MTKNEFGFDTTLRDGEQSPGCSMNLPEKVAWRGNWKVLGLMSSRRAFRLPQKATLPQ